MKHINRIILPLALALGSLSASAPAAGGIDAAKRPGPLAKRSVLPPSAARVLAAPSPVLGTDKRRHLVYEILVNNPTPSRVRLDRLDVRGAANHNTVDSLGGRAIEQLMITLNQGEPMQTSTLKPNQAGMLLLGVRLRLIERVPHRLEHRFTLTFTREGTGSRVRMKGASTRVRQRNPVQISSPLRRPNLGVIGCCSPPFTHRIGLFQFDDRIGISQRYAIDFLQLDDQVNSFAGDPTVNESYFIYGAKIRAVAPGRVVAVRDGMAETTPPNPPSNIGTNDLAGNYVTQDLGGQRFALYAHLQPGSIAVEPGERVRRGQVIGLVGNSGNSTEPHLHFQVMDGPGGPSSLDAEGLPYVFNRFRLVAVVTGVNSNPPAPVREPAPPIQRIRQFPLTGDVISVGSK